MSQPSQPPSPKGDLPAAVPQATTDPEVTEEDRRSRSSIRSGESTRSRSMSPLYKVCSGCNKRNKLMKSDLHDECMCCLGTDHLFRMKSCPACQALGFKDRLERARRFIHQRKTGQFISARSMRSLIAQAEKRPSYLERAFLEPYFVVTGTSPVCTPKKPAAATVSIPPERQEALRKEDRSRSLLIRAVSQRARSEGSATCPIHLDSSSDEEVVSLVGSEEEVLESPSQSSFITRELQAARRERSEIRRMLETFQATAGRTTSTLDHTRLIWTRLS